MIELNVTKNTNTAIPGTAGLYYPRVEYKGTLEMKDLAKLLSKHSTTFTQGEMIGVLTDAAQLIKEKILDGYVVKIEDLGLFKATVEGNGLKLEQGAKISAGVGSQRKAEDLAEDITLQQSAIGAVKLLVQATGETTISEMTRDGKTRFTSKAKALIKSLTGNNVQGDSEEENGGNSGSGSGSGSTTQSGYALTISKTGSGSATVTKDGNAVSSGDSLNEDDEVEIVVTAASGATPSATINGSEIELTHGSGDTWTGNFAMPAQASTLVVNTGSSSGGDGGDGLTND